MNIGEDYEVVEDPEAPKGRRIVKKGQSEAPKEEVTRSALDIARDAYQEATGNKPDGRWSLTRLTDELDEIEARS